MKIEFKLGTYRATDATPEEAEKLKRAGWVPLPALKAFMTPHVARAAPWVDACVGEAARKVLPFVEQRRAAIAASVAATADIKIPVGPWAAERGFDFRGYQKAGIAFMRSRARCINGDVPRLGKTVQAVGLANTYAVGEIRRVLVLCPANAKISWKEHFERWSIHQHLKVGYVEGAKRPEADVLIVNWDTIGTHIDYVRSLTWDIVIGDEIHRCSSFNSARTRHVLGTEKDAGQGGIQARLHWVGLSGTPLGTRPRNLWPIVRFMDPEGLGRNVWDFKRRYCGASKLNQWDDTGATNMEELQFKLRSSIMVRRDKHDVSEELPPLRERVSLSKEGLSKFIRAERSAMQVALDEFRARLEEEGRDQGLPQEDEESAEQLGPKDLALAALPMMIDFINEQLETEQKVVVFAHHRAVTAALRDAFPDCAYIVGGLSTAKREAERVRFQEDPACRVIVGSITSCYENLTLAAADVIVFCERVWWTHIIAQAEERVWLPTKTVPTAIFHLVVEGSADEEMANILLATQDAIERATVAKRLQAAG
jgi:SNF2 family DNA or RNA helicase